MVRGKRRRGRSPNPTRPLPREPVWSTALKMEPGAPRLLYAPSSLSGVTAAAKSTMKKAAHTVWPCGPVESIYSAENILVHGSNRDSDSPTCCRLRFDTRRRDGARAETAVAFADATKPVPLEPVWITTFWRKFSTVSAPSVSGTVSATSMAKKAQTTASAQFRDMLMLA